MPTISCIQTTMAMFLKTLFRFFSAKSFLRGRACLLTWSTCLWFLPAFFTTVHFYDDACSVVPKAASSSIVQTCMSTFFRRHGVFVTRHPLLVLCASLLVPILLCIGLIRFKAETRLGKLVLATSVPDQPEAPTIVNADDSKLLFQIQKKYPLLISA